MENFDHALVCRFCIEDPDYGARVKKNNAHSHRRYTGVEKARRREQSRSTESIEKRRVYARIRKRVITDLALRERVWVSEETARRVAKGET
jgi:hypothetical protein